MSDGIAFSSAIRNHLLEGWGRIFDHRLIGAWLYGSAVIGDFDPDVSDIDMTVALDADASNSDLVQLLELHADAIRKFPEWQDRVETQYISRAALSSFRTHRNRMINISPGEPIHFIETGIEWLTNWYFNRDHGVAMYGPPASDVFPEISQEEFVQACRDHAMDWLHGAYDLQNTNQQSYAVLTLSRALYTHRHGKQVSKNAAADWVQNLWPQYAPLVNQARVWRKQPATLSLATQAATQEFVQRVTTLIQQES